MQESNKNDYGEMNTETLCVDLQLPSTPDKLIEISDIGMPNCNADIKNTVVSDDAGNINVKNTETDAEYDDDDYNNDTEEVDGNIMNVDDDDNVIHGIEEKEEDGDDDHDHQDNAEEEEEEDVIEGLSKSNINPLT
jgi:hypothetical protein